MTLPTALRINAACSFATGILLAAAPNTVGGWLDVSIAGWLRLLGVALIAHGAFLVWAARHASITVWAKLNVATIAPYPLLMFGLAAAGFVDGVLGRSLVVLDGVVVGILAIAQWSTLRLDRATTHHVHA